MTVVPLSEYEVIPPEDFDGQYSAHKQPWYIDQNPVREGEKTGRLRVNFPDREYLRKWFDPEKYLVQFNFDNPRYMLLGPVTRPSVTGFFGKVDTTPKRSTTNVVKPWVPDGKNIVQVSVPVGTRTLAAAKIRDRRFISTLVRGPRSGRNPTGLWLAIPRYEIQPDLSRLGGTLL